MLMLHRQGDVHVRLGNATAFSFDLRHRGGVDFHRYCRLHKPLRTLGKRDAANGDFAAHAAACISHTTTATNMPMLSAWWLAHVVWICRIAFLLALVMLTAAIGLLFRKEWARRLLIGFMLLGILCKCAATVMQWWIPLSTYTNLQLPSNTSPETVEMMQSFASMMQHVLVVMRIFSVISAIIVSVLLGWIIRRLSSRPIRAEFQAVAFPLGTSGHAP